MVTPGTRLRVYGFGDLRLESGKRLLIVSDPVSELQQLLASAGFMLTNVLPLPNDVMILEARPSAG
jgi:hypothetical protein